MEERYSLYDGSVELVYNDARHSYHVIEGELTFRVPSVTTVCGVIDKSGALVQWASNTATEVFKGAIQPDTPYAEEYLEAVANAAKYAHRGVKADAASVGTQAHHWLEDYFKQDKLGEEPEDARVRNCIHAALSWLDSREVKKVEVERRIYSRRHKFSGTLDKLALVDGVLSLIDWKSSKGIYAEHRLQTAAYVGAWEEEVGQRIEKRFLIRLGKEDGEFEAHEYPRAFQKPDYRTFISALKLYQGLRKIK